jgi:hypothetical protein
MTMPSVRRLAGLLTAGLLSVLFLPESASAANCNGTSTGVVPLTDLPPLLYLGREGGLCPGATNFRPASHDRDADRTARVRLLNPTGQPDPVSGRIVLLSVGMSNTTQEYQRFMQIAGPDPQRNQAVVLVDGAQGGWSADRLADPTQNETFWSTVQNLLAGAGVTAAQVQAVWLKEADRQPDLPFPDDALKLQGEIETIIRDIRTRFPNVRQLYLSARIYGGYASTNLNPDSYSALLPCHPARTEAPPGPVPEGASYPRRPPPEAKARPWIPPEGRRA